MSATATASSSQEIKKKRVMIGLPGQTFSNQFLLSWTKFLVELMREDSMNINLFQGYSTFSTYTRMKTLGLEKQQVHVKAFDGIDYDVFVTIDPTIIFTYEQFKTLVSMTDQHPAVSAIYHTTDKTVNAVEKMDYKTNERTTAFRLLSIDEIKEKPFLKVDYTTLGFFACRRTVLQALDYPYFWYPLVDYTSEDGTPCREVLSDEIAFSRRLTDKGYQITLLTDLRVNQEKQVLM